jgi:hypothetical protein
MKRNKERKRRLEMTRMVLMREGNFEAEGMKCGWRRREYDGKIGN